MVFIISEDEEKCRIDSFVTGKLGNISRALVQKSILEGLVKANDVPVNKNYKIKTGDKIDVSLMSPESIEILPEDIPLDVVYEDEDVVVINKKKGMVVHPATGNYSGTMVNALVYRYGENLSTINGNTRPGIVHRIDKDTSGLLLVAKNDFAHENLAEQIKAHSLKREYEAVVYGRVKWDKGRIDKPIGRNPNDRIKRVVIYQNSKSAVTNFEVLARYQNFSHLCLRLETGRTHQIRVHMSHIGYPLAGDKVYGPKKVIKSLQGQCLHARTLGFIHPRTKEYIEIKSELPEYFREFLDKLGGKNAKY